MAKWACYGVVKGSKYLGEVEADTKEEAQEAALQLDSASVSFCWECSDECEDPNVDEVVVEKKD